MPKHREGFKSLTLQFPLELYAALERQLAETPAAAGSMNRLVCLMLAEREDVALPPPKRLGRPPAAARPKKGKKL